jgi:hypothetical protein
MEQSKIVDASMTRSKALPNGADTATSPSLDLGPTTAWGQRDASVEFKLSAPALAVGELPDGETMTYSILTSDNADLSSPTVLMPSVIVQTGAGGAGAAAASYLFRLPSDSQRYLGFKAVNSGAGDASAKSASMEARF